MRIAYVCADRGIPVGGTKGASIHVRGMARALARRGHELRILAAHAVDPPPTDLPPVIGFGYDVLLKELRGEIGALQDPLIANEACCLLMNGALSRSLHELDARWGVETVYERYSLWSFAALQFARERRVPYILEVNAPLVAEQGEWRGLSMRAVASGLEKVMLQRADAVNVPSEALRAYVCATGRRRHGVHVLPNGVDLALFRERHDVVPREIADRLQGRFVIAFLGTLKPWHGIEPLWQAFTSLRRRLPEAHLLVIGDGPMREYLARAAERLGGNALTLTGAVGHEQVPALLALAQVGVAPYPPLEPFYFCPLKVIEYMAAGLPVVASAIGDIPRLVPDGRAGLLVPPGVPSALSQAILRLARNPRLRSALGARARTRAEARFDWDHGASRIEAIMASRAARIRAPAPAVSARGRRSVVAVGSVAG